MDVQKLMFVYEKVHQLLGDFVPPDPLPGLCPWTPLGDFRPPDLLFSLTPHFLKGSAASVCIFLT